MIRGFVKMEWTRIQCHFVFHKRQILFPISINDALCQTPATQKVVFAASDFYICILFNCRKIQKHSKMYRERRMRWIIISVAMTKIGMGTANPRTVINSGVIFAIVGNKTGKNGRSVGKPTPIGSIQHSFGGNSNCIM